MALVNKSAARKDLEVFLRTANTVVEGMLPRARRLRARISSLRESASDDVPEFGSDFTQEGLFTYIDRLEEWIRSPWRARSRNILQDHGINCEGLPMEVLDDSEGVENTTAAITLLQRSGNPALSTLKDCGLVTL